jgi:hypothetical protein
MSDLFHEVELALVEVFLTELGSKLKISKFKTYSKLCHKYSYIVCRITETIYNGFSICAGKKSSFL